MQALPNFIAFFNKHILQYLTCQLNSFLVLYLFEISNCIHSGLCCDIYIYVHTYLIYITTTALNSINI